MPADAAAARGHDPLVRLRDRIAADGPAERRRWLPRFGSPMLWLLDEPLLFGAVLVAVLLLGLALGARLFHPSDERRLIVPTVVVEHNPPLQATAPAVRAAPPAAPIATDAPTVAPSPPAASRPTTAPATASAPLQAAATPASVPPPAAGPSLSNIVNGAARQPANAAVPPPAAGFPTANGASGAAGSRAAAGSAGAAGATGAGAAAATNQPPDLDAAFQRVVTQGQRAATAAAQRGPAPAPPRTVPLQPTAQH